MTDKVTMPQKSSQLTCGIKRREVLRTMGTAATADYAGSVAVAMPGSKRSSDLAHKIRALHIISGLACYLLRINRGDWP